MKDSFSSEQEKLLHDISILDFIVVELAEYLDTHPTDQNAIEYFNHYNRLNHQAKQEYSSKFTPLTLSGAAPSGCRDWQWALSSMPWEGGCN